MQSMDQCCLIWPLICAVPILFGLILVISVLMLWMNVRRLRVSLHTDLAALRESLDRLSGYAAPTDEAVAQEEAPATESSEIPAEPEKIGFSCPECGKFFEGPATLAGTAYKCPECHVDFHIH